MAHPAKADVRQPRRRPAGIPTTPANFKKRGNHSEAHLSEVELAVIIETAVRVALEQNIEAAK